MWFCKSGHQIIIWVSWCLWPSHQNNFAQRCKDTRDALVTGYHNNSPEGFLSLKRNNYNSASCNACNNPLVIIACISAAGLPLRDLFLKIRYLFFLGVWLNQLAHLHWFIGVSNGISTPYGSIDTEI